MAYAYGINCILLYSILYVLKSSLSIFINLYGNDLLS